MKWKRINTIGFVLALGLLVSLALYILVATMATMTATTQRMQARRMLVELKNVFSQLQDVEIATRDFLISGKEADLQPYRDAQSNTVNTLTRIAQMRDDGAAVPLDLAELRSLVDTILAAAQETAAARRTQSVATALREASREREALERLRGIMSQHESAVLAALEGRAAEAATRNRRALMAMVAGGGISLLLLLFLYVSLRREVARRRRAQEQLSTLNAELVVASERAQSADRLKSAFLATMSHELRTPLNSIIGFTGILLQELAGPLNPEQTKQLGIVQVSARHLLALINDVLDISKIEAGQLEIRAEPFALRTAVEKVATLVRPQAEKKGLALKVEIAPAIGAIVSDRIRVEQVLLNLINNAIKFTDHGGITVRADLQSGSPGNGAPGTGPAVNLVVRDTGIGIKPEDMAQLFQPFRQIDSGLTRTHEGTGLGLAICRRLAEHLGGAIAVASTWGQGSTFTFVVPVNPQTNHETNRPVD